MSESNNVVAENEEPQQEEEEQELVDPLESLKENCGNSKECIEYKERLAQCNDRVNSRSKTTETCQEELSDYLHCIDHCVAPKILKYLK
uniref:Cytochrome b-c1 complex subunit 6 n=1 Tax=Artemia franciscana TaxID=6661 RepID=B1PT28_ARTSF|nr:mitochondrial ubiquinol-cytochrome c reductase complex 11 kDa protein [Artemia franciscana]